MTPLSTINGVNLNVFGVSVLFVVPAGKTLVVTLVNARCTLAGAPNNNGTVTVTRLSDGANLDLGMAAVPGIVGQALNLSLTQNQIFPTVAAGDTVQFNVNLADTGNNFSASVDLFGYLV